jgi:hypothetical protein
MSLSVFLYFSRNSGKGWCNRDAVAVFSFAGAAVAGISAETRSSIADNSLQKIAKTASREH